MRAKQHALWDELRSSACRAATLVPTARELADAVIEMVHGRYVAVHKEQLKRQFAQQANVSDILSQRKQALAIGNLLPPQEDQVAVEKLAIAIANERSWNLRGDTLEGLKLQEELARLISLALTLARRDVIGELEGSVSPTSRDDLLSRFGIESPKESPQGSGILDLFSLYSAAAQKKQDTLSTERKVVELFAQFVGQSRDVSSVTKSEFREFRNALQKVPVNWQLRSDLKDLSLRQVAKQWHATGGQGRNVKTIAKEWSGLSSFFKWLVSEGYCDENLTVGLAPKVDKRSGRMPVYSAEKLKVVFDSALFGGCVGDGKEHLLGRQKIRDWRYWIPLCAAYSGARTGEIAQLHCSDLKEVDGIWVFDVVEGGDDEAGSKSLKTASSRRKVPIHRVLIELGLLDHCFAQRAKGSARLFPEIIPCERGMLSTPVSKFWQRYLKRLDIKERGLALHSFRHTFADEVRRRGGLDAILGSILGHAKGTMTSRYGADTEGNLAQRKALIDLVDYGLIHTK